MLVDDFIVVLTLVLYVLALYTVLAQEKNDLVKRRGRFTANRVLQCREVRREAEEVLKDYR